MGLILKPWSERSRSDLSVMGELQPKFGAVSGVNIFATAPSAIPVGAGELPIEFVITYPGDYTELADTPRQASGRSPEEWSVHLHQCRPALLDAAG